MICHQIINCIEFSLMMFCFWVCFLCISLFRSQEAGDVIDMSWCRVTVNVFTSFNCIFPSFLQSAAFTLTLPNQTWCLRVVYTIAGIGSMDRVILWTRTLLHGQISPGQVVWRDGAGRWLGPLLTYLTMWTLGHRRNILIYLTMTLLTRRRDTALNEETHLSFTLSTNYFTTSTE